MKQTTHNSETLYLFPYPADWKQRVSSEFLHPGAITTGLSAREERFAKAESLRVQRFTFSTILDAAESRELLDALRAKTTERIAIPFWPAVQTTADFATTEFYGAINITFEADANGWPDFSSYEIHTGRAPTGSFTNGYTAPLLLGRLNNEAKLVQLLSDEISLVGVDFAEDSEVSEALTIDAQSYTAGPTIGALTPDLFPARVDFKKQLEQGVVLPLETIQIGQGRRLTLEFHSAAGFRNHIASVVAGENEVLPLLKFFSQQHGAASVFWLPAHLAETRLTSAAAAGATSLAVADGLRFNTHTWAALLDRDNVQPLTVTAATANSLTVSPALTNAVTLESSLCSLLLARFYDEVLRIDWKSPQVAQARIHFTELPPEYSAPAGETIGTTLGSTGVRASLYELTDGTTTWRYTSYERDLTSGGNTFTTFAITHGPIHKSTDLSDNVTLEAAADDDHPLTKLWSGEIQKLDLTIQRADVAGAIASNPTTHFKGALQPPSLTGSKLTAEGLIIGRAADQLLPKGPHAKVCAYPLYSTGCALAQADWTWTAQLAGTPTAGYPFQLVLDTFDRENTDPDPAGWGLADWFAWGRIEYTSDGVTQKRTIRQSTAEAAGQITVTLDRDFDPMPADNDQVKLIPGCDGQHRTCQAYDATTNPLGKFGNYANWGGALVAPANLSLVKVSSNVGGGKK